jgi:hypothetical protein
MLAMSLIIIGIVLRIAPHAPNFTPVAAIALFSGIYLNKKYAFLIPLALMVLSDMFVGMHNVVIFTWGGFLLTTLIGAWVKKHKGLLPILSGSLASSLVFYIVSNFGVWLMGWYPKTLKGLIDCYIMGLPFIRNFVFATILYTFIFVGIYELVARWVKEKNLAKALLTI